MVNEYLFSRLFEDEADALPLVKRELEIGSSGRRRLTFNVTNVVLDFDTGTATIEDVLEADASYTMRLADLKQEVFRRGRGGMGTHPPEPPEGRQWG